MFAYICQLYKVQIVPSLAFVYFLTAYMITSSARMIYIRTKNWLFKYLRNNFIFGKGSWIGLWAIWYGTQRAILDTLRFGMGDATIGIFTWNQIGGSILAIIGLGVFLRNKNLK